MQALQLTRAGEPLEAVILSPQAPGPGEVQVQVQAAGICHSDVHYRSGQRVIDPLPVVPGHEVAGTIHEVGKNIDRALVGTRVALHYVVSCGTCRRCHNYGEQFCENYEMLGVTTQGGFAEMVTVPDRNAITIPDDIATEHAAIMMCSSATALHSLHRGRLEPGETVAIFGVGGLGMSAVQLAIARGATRVFAIDIDEARLATAETLGATAISADDTVTELAALGGVDVALIWSGRST